MTEPEADTRRPSKAHMRAWAVVAGVICCLTGSLQAHAWNKAGHMVMAAIAYADLKERRPDVAPKVVQILRQHPHFKYWADKLSWDSSAYDQDLHLFMWAARWADDVRGDNNYDRPDQHFVNIPFRPREAGMEIPRGPSILQAFPEHLSIVESITSDEEARAAALCWVLHLIGDVHQPLHTIKLVTPQFPEPRGDRGGTRFYVRVTPNSSTISLHKLWDGLILGSYRLRAVRKKATELRNRPALRRESLAGPLRVTSFNDWATESYAFAVKDAYLNGELEGSDDKYRAPALPRGYLKMARLIAERRIVLSGYRLSDVLVEIFGQ